MLSQTSKPIAERTSATEPLLRLKGVEVGMAGGPALLRGIGFTARRGEMTALVGESGCGKSLTALTILGLLPPGLEVRGGRIELDGAGDLLALDAKGWRGIRGARIAMIFQDPTTALNPVLSIGFQIAEVLRRHHAVGRRAARRRAEELLERVAMPDARRRLASYPHELSGGQRQRAMIALALAADPVLLLADEPTTALDVTIQAQILELLDELRRDLGLAIVHITHDLGLVAQTADRVVVLYAGEVVEEAPVSSLFRAPGHPYTRALLCAVPVLTDGGASVEEIPGRIPEPGSLPAGCVYHPRCSEVMAACRKEIPASWPAGDAEQRARCFLYRPAADGLRRETSP